MWRKGSVRTQQEGICLQAEERGLKKKEKQTNKQTPADTLLSARKTNKQTTLSLSQLRRERSTVK